MTTVFIKKDGMDLGDFMFLKGGNQHGADIPIRHATKAPNHYTEYKFRQQRDHYLSWGGSETDQGTYYGEAAKGTPMLWATNNASMQEVQPLAKYENLDNYWMVTMNMDCSQTENGWFRVKGFVTPESKSGYGWESNVNQGQCTGNHGLSYNGASDNHYAYCGAINVFDWNSGSCRIDKMPQRTVVMIKKQTQAGENIFIRGGTSGDQPIRIIHQTKVPTNFAEYQAWSAGDDTLEWGGAQAGQGTFNGVAAGGTPLAWSTNDANNAAHNPYNTFGEHYWIAELDVDCSGMEGQNGWFSLKVFMNGPGKV